jgi:hypothetical protein
LSVAAWLVSIGGCASDPPSPSEITGLHFTTSSSSPSNPPPAVDVTLTDATSSRNIYSATLALPTFPAGTYNCPADFGLSYSIAFLEGSSTAVTATLSPGGCRAVTISGPDTRRVLDDAYWALLARNLGVTESAIYPSPMP